MAKKEKKAAAPQEQVPAPTPRLQERYEKEIRGQLASKLGRSNPLSLPRLEKVVISMGVGSAIAEKKHMEDAVAALAQISGQKPLITRSRMAIANFRLRENLAIGCKVTLRGPRMYEFLDRLISLALPRVRDFRGLNPNAFDGHGNYSLGLSEQLVFPELNPDKFLRTQGMNVTMVMAGSRGDEESRELLKGFGMPFRTDQAQSDKVPAA
ncbi:MAG: 50S ribosomal protein L5 [Pirellulales bacterium]